MSKLTSSKIPSVSVIFITASIILAIAIGAWFRLVYTRPAATFNRMLNTMLSTTGVSKKITQTQDGQQISQDVQLTAQPVARVHSLSVLKQGDGGTVITTENVGTLTADYVRYADIKTSQKTADGKAFDFKTVLGIWGKADAKDPESGGAQLFNQTVLGVVPVGNLNAAARQKLMNQIVKDKVYSVDYASVARNRVAGRPQYSYDVTVQPVAYVGMLKSYAREIGIKELESVDPAQYKETPPLKFNFIVDVWSGQLQTINYIDSERSETYSSYGARLRIETPVAQTTVQDIQTRLQKLQ